MPNLPEGHMNTLETGPLLEIQSGELRRELLLSRIIGNAFAVLLIGTAEIKESAERAAVFAVLDATNRWAEARRPT